VTIKIDSELRKQIEAAAAEPQREIPVIVNLAAEADVTELTRRGLKIENVFDSISAVAGTLTAAEIRALSQWDQVTAIEYDGQMYAL